MPPRGVGERGPLQQSPSCSLVWGDGQQDLGSFCGCVLALSSLAGQGWALCAPRVTVPLFPGAHWVDKCRFGNQSLFLRRPFCLILRGAALLCLFLSNQCGIFPKQPWKKDISALSPGAWIPARPLIPLLPWDIEVGMRVQRQLRSRQVGCAGR